jgi:ubiquinone/menaquinone biosynthesis C-methylase UbiE
MSAVGQAPISSRWLSWSARRANVVGLDASEVMIAEARRRVAELDLPVTFEVGDVAGAKR